MNLPPPSCGEDELRGLRAMPHPKGWSLQSWTTGRSLPQRMFVHALFCIALVGIVVGASAGNVKSAPADATWEAALRDLRLVGFVSAEIGSRNVVGTVRESPGLYFNWEAAGYGRTTASVYSVTTAFDTRDKSRQELLANKSAFSYPVLGDSSTTATDAVSRGPFYLQVQDGDSYLLIGDYRTDFTGSQLVVYDRQLTGLKLHRVGNTNSGRISATVMTAAHPQVTKTDVLPSLGTVGYYRLTEQNIVPGSERISIMAGDGTERDAATPRRLQRGRDYVIDYLDGTVLFQQPVPLADGQGNVYHIVVRYEYEADSAARQTTLMRLTYTRGKSDVGLSLVSDEASAAAGTSRRHALGVDGVFRLAPWLRVEGEWATAGMTESGQVPLGQGWRLTVAGDVHPRLTYSLGHTRQDADYIHLHAEGPSDVDQDNTNAQVTYRPALTGSNTDLVTSIAYNRRHDQPVDVATIGLKSERITLSSGYGFDGWRLRGNVETGRFSQVRAGSERWKSWGYRLSAAYELPAGHQVGVFRSGTTATSDSTGFTESEGTTGLQYDHVLNERTDLSTGYSIEDAGQHSFWAGIASRVVDGDALTTDVYSRYQLDGVMSGATASTMFGVNNRWRLTDALAVDFGYERTEGSPSAPGSSGEPKPPGTPSTVPPTPSVVRDAWNAAVSFTPDSPYRLSVRYSTGTQNGRVRQFAQVNALGQLSDDVSLSVALSWSSAPDGGGTGLSLGQRQTIGLAYRPLHSSRFNALAMYERERSSTAITHTTSAEASYWLSSEFELAGKIAYRHLDAGVHPAPRVQTNTMLYQARGTYAFAPRWDATLIYRLLHLRPSQGAELRHHGWQASTGFAFIESDPRWRLEAGYRYADYEPDADPSADAFVSGPFARLTYRF